MICTKCHTDVRGPFVYEHAPVKAETCLACHSPHGSQNARMLNMPNINVLCNQCHSAVGAGAIHGQGAGVVGQRALHKLPHLHSWLKHECGVSQIGVMEPCPERFSHRRGAAPTTGLHGVSKVRCRQRVLFK